MEEPLRIVTAILVLVTAIVNLVAASKRDE